MGMRSRHTAFSMGVAIVALASGCGGSSSTKPLTRAELIAKANPVCRRVSREVDWSKVNTKEFSPRRAAELGALEERAASELNELTPPPSLLFNWRMVVDDHRAIGPVFKHMAQVLIIKGAQGYPVLPLAASQNELAMNARAVGAEECAKY
jgi:hypothetical protein